MTPTPTLVLTRPAAQSRALAEQLGVGGTAIIAPILEIEGTGREVDLSAYAGVILTSANAVRFVKGLAGIRADCVGARTAEAARAAGAAIGVVAENADELVEAVKGPGPVLHLRGEYVRGNIAERLNAAGIETDEVVIYRQRARALSAEAREAIEGDAPAILPLYSPRSARLVGESVSRLGPALAVIAMSPAVAEAWAEATGGTAEVCAVPTGDEMARRIAAALRG